MQTEQGSGDILILEETYERASTGKRFANYVIDILIFYILMFGVGVLIALTAPSVIDAIPEDDSGFALLDRLISLAIYGLYMSIVEALFKGKSLGKLITKTRAVNLDGTRISTATAFKRGFSRAVPFCVFSAFGNPCDPWHDRWNDTMVVDDTSM